MFSFLSYLINFPKSKLASAAKKRPTSDHRGQLAARIHGQKIIVPDLTLIYTGWKVRRHPDVEKMRKELETWFTTYVPTDKQRTRQRKVDSALCSGLFWTNVSPENYAILCSLMAWFFFWDDEMDDGDVTEHKDKAEAYCDDTVAFIKSCLQPEHGITPPAPGRLHNSGAYLEIGKAMQTGQSIEDRDRFAGSILQYIETIRAQQNQRLTGITSVADYIERRVVSIASTPCLTVLPWAYGLSMPDWIWEHESTNRVLREVAMGVFLGNDIISLKKELLNDEVDSIVPVFVYNEKITAQKAVDKAVALMRQSYQDFEAAASRLRDAVSKESQQVKDDVNVWIGAAMDVLVGNYVWSANAPRYIPKSAFTEGFAFQLVL
ncbi:terpenoid synthase [Plenodomus tracheiphilus IPT5]|uniref:Terpene synthase n=1 Tax=Plenodomus tracheiphilus IPT5 TaxID=1408161 RepID=A0A6A7B9C2_9PLEO|nr:terpenoid synthase [Plenodomus tracheiphilus IPT5]